MGEENITPDNVTKREEVNRYNLNTGTTPFTTATPNLTLNKTAVLPSSVNNIQVSGTSLQLENTTSLPKQKTVNYTPDWTGNSTTNTNFSTMNMRLAVRANKFSKVGENGYNIGTNFNADWLGNDRIGKNLLNKMHIDVNGNTIIDASGLGRRSMRRLRKATGGASNFLNFWRQLYGLSSINTGNVANRDWSINQPVQNSNQPVNPEVKTQTDLPTHKFYEFKGFDNDWLNRTNQFYAANSNNENWANMDTNNDGIITVDEMKSWQTSKGLKSVDGKLGRDTATAMGISNLNDYGWMNVQRNNRNTNSGSKSNLQIVSSVTDKNKQYSGGWNVLAKAKAASAKRAYEYYRGGGQGTYTDKYTGKRYTSDGKMIIRKNHNSSNGVKNLINNMTNPVNPHI